jgi:hypothetical protein
MKQKATKTMHLNQEGTVDLMQLMRYRIKQFTTYLNKNITHNLRFNLPLKLRADITCLLLERVHTSITTFSINRETIHLEVDSVKMELTL